VKKTFVMLALSFAVSSAFAAQGGEGNNTGCNGQGNPESPCQGGAGGAGGQGGAGGNANNSTVNVINNRSVNRNRNEQSQGQSQNQGQSLNNNTQALGISEAHNAGNTVTIVDVQRPQAPAVSAPSMSSTANCRVAHAAGVSAPGFGLSLGSSSVDETCELIELSKRAEQLNLRDVATQLMCLNRKFKQVAGPLCLD
jgi:hypothetical protein